ncbi:hypothetical protein [Anaeromyxobacter dehalogenans]|uniref:hypothetical protein n=1 Tax=Anaeromyxobacter dehalogenans TaxID=161493 RepID=UPI0002F8FCD8|nr:hypothetical protein [Anaeromyxobacter dehalogenans]
MTPPRTVAIDLRARRAYPWMAGIVLAIPGVIVEDEASGTRVKVREDGGLDELVAPGHPQHGAAFDPTNTREARHG